jgi:hypothetical protein
MSTTILPLHSSPPPSVPHSTLSRSSLLVLKKSYCPFYLYRTICPPNALSGLHSQRLPSKLLSSQLYRHPPISCAGRPHPLQPILDLPNCIPTATSAALFTHPPSPTKLAFIGRRVSRPFLDPKAMETSSANPSALQPFVRPKRIAAQLGRHEYECSPRVSP